MYVVKKLKIMKTYFLTTLQVICTLCIIYVYNIILDIGML